MPLRKIRLRRRIFRLRASAAVCGFYPLAQTLEFAWCCKNVEAQLGARQILGRVMRNKQLGAKSRRPQRQQDEPWWARARQPGAK